MALALVMASSIVAVRPAQAFTAFNAPLTGGSDYITGFAPCGGPTGIGPIGVLHDGDSFFVTGFCSGTTYKFPASGGTLPGNLSAANGLTHGVAKANGHYYGISRGAAGVERGLYRFDPATLALGSRVAVVPGDARQVSPDPLGSGLFMSSDQGVFRVDDPDGAPAVTKLTSGNVDGMVFTNDGQHLWGAYIGENRVKRLSRAGAVEADILTGHRPDGLAVARSDAPSGAGLARVSSPADPFQLRPGRRLSPTAFPVDRQPWVRSLGPPLGMREGRDDGGGEARQCPRAAGLLTEGAVLLQLEAA